MRALKRPFARPVTREMKTFYGCASVRGPLESYARRFELAEVDLFSGQKPVRLPTLRRWRKDAGPTFTFSLVSPPAVAKVRPGPELDAALEEWLEAQRLLQARFLLLAPPIDVTPSPLQRERIAALVGRVREGLGEAREVVRIAWQPRGVWELDTAAQFAQEIGVDLCADPLLDPREPFWHPTLRYIRVGTVGGRMAFPPARLRQLAEILHATQDAKPKSKPRRPAKGPDGDESDRESEVAEAAHTDVRVVILATPKAPTEVRRLERLVHQLDERPTHSQDQGAGGGLIISPRRGALGPGTSEIGELDLDGEEE